MSKKLTSVLLAVILVVTALPLTAMAKTDEVVESKLQIKDMPEDWSKDALVKAVDNGLLQGSNGEIRPKDNLTRAEMAAILNRVLRPSKKADLKGFSDVKEDAWYYDDMAKAVEIGLFKGYDSKLNPENPISREEAFTVIARAFKADTDYINSNNTDKFKDFNKISDFAKDSIEGLHLFGYIDGFEGMIKPKDNISRAEFAKLMDNLVSTYVSKEGEFSTDVKGNLLLNNPRISLKGLVVEGDLIIAEGVLGSDLDLTDVVVKGRIIVRGGGDLNLKGKTKAKEVILSNTKDIEMTLDKNVEVEEIVLESKATLKGQGKVDYIKAEEGSDGSKIELSKVKVQVSKDAKDIKDGKNKVLEPGKVTEIKDQPVTDSKPSTSTPSTGGSSGGSSGGSEEPSKTDKEKSEEKIRKIVAEMHEYKYKSDELEVTVDVSKDHTHIVDVVIKTNKPFSELNDTEIMVDLYNKYEELKKTNHTLDKIEVYSEDSNIEKVIFNEEELKSISDLKIFKDKILNIVKNNPKTLKVNAHLDGEYILYTVNIEYAVR